AITGIYETTNEGATWTNTTAAVDTIDPWSAIVVDPATTGATAVLYAAVGNPNGAANNGVYESTNGGAGWTQLGTPGNQVDAVDTINPGGLTSGSPSFTLTFNGSTSGPIAVGTTPSATATNIQNA